MTTPFDYLNTCAPIETREAIAEAIKDGYHYIDTFAGTLEFETWLESTALKAPLHYENGRLYTQWFASILEPGKMERQAFVLR